MSRRLIIRPEAEADIMNAAVWYEAREDALGLAFTVEIHNAIERALEAPLVYLHLRELPHVRRILVRRFPYRVFYIVRADAIVVFAFSMPRNMSDIGNIASEGTCGNRALLVNLQRSYPKSA